MENALLLFVVTPLCGCIAELDIHKLLPTALKSVFLSRFFRRMSVLSLKKKLALNLGT